MLRRALSLCVVLGLASSAYAGVAITLNAAAPADGVAYQPGEIVTVGFLAQLTAGTPSVPGPGGSTSLVRVRLMQFDLADSSPELQYAMIGHHPLQESQTFAGPIPFWDYSGSTACAADETACGTNYFVDGSLTDATPTVLNTTYTGQTSSGSFMITLNQTTPKQVGELNVIMPSVAGEYKLDVLNADETDVNLGAQLRWGFGSTADPADPTSPLLANTGGITYSAQTGAGGLSFAVVPEPATLALLGLGGLATAFRRRRSA